MLLTKNSKMRKSSGRVYNFTLPALKALDGTITCPNAKQCAIGCYARMGAYVWSNVAQKHNANLQATRQPDFVDLVSAEVNKLRPTHVRIHDAGDFYSLEYATRWIEIAKMHPSVIFYAYTKQVSMFKRLASLLPSNFIVIFSLGGKEDHLINPLTDRHSRVFETEQELVYAGYIDASHDDMLALTSETKVGLVYHGTKKFSNTNWDKLTNKEINK